MRVDQRYRFVYKPLLFAAGLMPFAAMLSGAFGWFGHDLGPDPVEEVLHACGKTALNFLILTLLVTPVRQVAGLPHVVRLRRMLGLFAFFYAALHFTVYVTVDQGLDLAGVIDDIAERPYITVGFTALVILVPLAVTSTNRMMRRLGRRWQTLHRLVYVAAILAVWHFYWQVKADVREPLVYAAALALLLGYRLARRSGRFARLRGSARRSERPSATTGPGFPGSAH